MRDLDRLLRKSRLRSLAPLGMTHGASHFRKPVNRVTVPPGWDPGLAKGLADQRRTASSPG
jgi:hypothetical protein